jgi:hypothetical protein
MDTFASTANDRQQAGISMADPVTSVWHLYGLSEDPFFQTELKAFADASYPPGLFVGRESELRLLSRQIGGAPSSRALVQGGAGVGKTSFVNRLKADLAGLGVLTHEKPVRIVGEMSPRAFVAEVLKVLLRIRNSMQRGAVKKAKESASAEGKFWTRIARLVEGQDLINAGVSAGPLGGSVERTRIPAEVEGLSLYDELEEAVTLLVKGPRGAERSGRQVLIHVNNLEAMSARDAQKAASLLLDVRDYLMVSGAHWIFVGTTGVESAVFRVHDQVGGIFPPALTLAPLTGDEVGEMLERRYRHLKRGQQYVPPIGVAAAVKIYRRYHGDLRNFLQLLSAACNIELGVRDTQPLSPDVILALMGPRFAAKIRAQIGETDYKHLRTIFKRANAETELRVTDIARRTRLHQTSASQLVSRLSNHGLLVATRTEARNTFYQAAGNTGIALGLVD